MTYIGSWEDHAMDAMRRARIAEAQVQRLREVLTSAVAAGDTLSATLGADECTIPWEVMRETYAEIIDGAKP